MQIQADSESEEYDGFVYAVRTVDAAFVKIGYSLNPEKRINQGSTYCPFALDIVLIIPGDQNRETEIHRALARFRYRREWFFWSDYVKGYLDDLAIEDVRHGTDDLIDGD